MDTSGNIRDNEGGFIPARRTNRKTPVTKPPVVFRARGSCEDLGRRLRENTGDTNTENITLSNSFGNLNGEMIESETQDAGISLVEDKENRITTTSGDIGKSNLVERDVRLCGKEGAKEVGKGSKSGRSNFGGPNGPRIKNKQNRPMRGLVFGPPNTNVDLVASGKRMSVESECADLPGGVFVKGRNDEVGTEKERNGDSTVPEVSELELGGDPSRRGMFGMAMEPQRDSELVLT